MASSPSALHSGPPRPVKGSSWYWNPTTQISSRPRKNTGSETPATLTAMMMRSNQEPRAVAASVPSAMPSGMDQNSDAAISSSVGPMVAPSSCVTGTLLMMETPRSPCASRAR